MINTQKWVQECHFFRHLRFRSGSMSSISARAKYTHSSCTIPHRRDAKPALPPLVSMPSREVARIHPGGGLTERQDRVRAYPSLNPKPPPPPPPTHSPTPQIPTPHTRTNNRKQSNMVRHYIHGTAFHRWCGITWYKYGREIAARIAWGA